MSFSFSKSVAEDVRAAITRGAPEAGAPLVLDGGGEIDLAAARRTLESGETVAVIHARAGNLDGLDPDNRIKVPGDLALYAVRRVPLQKYPGRYRNVVTMLPHPAPPSAALAGAPEASERITARLRSHMAPAVESADFAPPLGAKWWTDTYSTTFEAVAMASWGWRKDNVNLQGRTQNARIDMTQHWSAVLADGDKANPYYVVRTITEGIANPGPLLGDDPWYRGALRSRYWVYVTPYSTLTPAISSPDATAQSPVTVEASFPMQVMGKRAPDDGGGSEPVPFTASFSASVANPDWAISRPAPHGWLYYNLTPWDASTENITNFRYWLEKVIDRDGEGGWGAVKDLNPSCKTGGSFKTVLFWKVPAAAEGSPTKVSFYSYAAMELTCFQNMKDDANRGKGHSDQVNSIGQWVPGYWPAGGSDWTSEPLLFDFDLDKWTRRAK